MAEPGLPRSTATGISSAMLTPSVWSDLLTDEGCPIEWKVANPDPCRPSERIRDRCGARHRRGLADALGAQRSHRRSDLDQPHVDVGKLIGGGELVVEKAGCAQLPVDVVGKLLAERAAQAL